jgi:hypothetical protein
MNRRGFLQSILAAGVMPAIVRADSLMAVTGFSIPSREIILPGQEIIVPVMSKGLRTWAVAPNSMAYMEARADGLIELYRTEKEIHFELKRRLPSEYENRKLII